MIRRLPFMLLVDDVEDLKGLYERVKRAMFGIHMDEAGELQSIAVEWFVPFASQNDNSCVIYLTCSNQDRSILGSDSGSCNNHCNFKMMIWLVIFYEFFDKKVINASYYSYIICLELCSSQ